jgi:P27 family predicted phage terminase small subunit
MTAVLKDPQTRAAETGNKPRARHVARASMLPKSMPIGRAPAWLTTDQRKVWRELVAVVDPGLLQGTDATRFAQLVIAVTTERAMLREWNAAGSPYQLQGKRGGVPIRHPLFTELRQIRKDLAPLVADFGLSPLARSRVKVPREVEDNPLSKFLKGL